MFQMDCLAPRTGSDDEINYRNDEPGAAYSSQTGVDYEPEPITKASGDLWWSDTETSKAQLRPLFEMVGGHDEDSSISVTELTHILKNLGERHDEELVDTMLDLVDADGNRELDFEEFFDVMTGKFDTHTHAAEHSHARPEAAAAMARAEQLTLAVKIPGEDTDRPRRPGAKDYSSTGEETAKILAGDTNSARDFSIREMQILFEEADVDNNGYLDKVEVRRLSERLHEKMDKRHLIDAMEALDPEGIDQVTFDQFRMWLFDAGHHWSDLIVLPEGQVLAIRRAATSHPALLPPNTSPSAAWHRLAVMLKLMNSTSLKWGTPREIRTNLKQDEKVGMNAEERVNEARIKRCFLRPESTFRTGWDLTQVVLLMYVLITVPLRIGFDIASDFGTWDFWVDLSVDVYFAVDILLNFRTAVYNNHGTLEIELGRIACLYLKSWFIIDILSCLPISYVTMIMAVYSDNDDSAGGAGSVRLFKMLRLIRLFKFLRVARIARLLERYEETLRPIMDGLGSFILLIFIFLFAHLVACMWYYTGTLNESCPGGEGSQDLIVPDGVMPKLGWVEREYPSCDARADCGGQCVDQVCEVFQTGNESVCYEPGYSTRYVTAMYWAMMTISTVGYGDYVAKTDAEKAFANGTMCVGALIFAGITGSLASRMMSRKGAVQAYNTRMDEIRQFMVDKKVPADIKRRVSAYYHALWSEKHVYDETQLLTSMPLSISGPIVSHLYTRALESVPLFRRLKNESHGDLILQRLCMEMKHIVALPGDVIMQEGHAVRHGHRPPAHSH
eukprot:SAG11_NODE_97_length_16960_cov_22.407405_2_plen_786_part_00